MLEWKTERAEVKEGEVKLSLPLTAKIIDSGLPSSETSS